MPIDDLPNINVCMPELQRPASNGHTGRNLRQKGSTILARTVALATILVACGPASFLPPRLGPLPPSLLASASDAGIARTLAPVLYLQRDEPFALVRALAVVDGRRRIVAYHLLWRDDAHGAWLPSTRPTDEEIVWVGYDSSGAPTEVWTFWHGRILHLPWNRRTVEIDVQWGKHGSLPRGLRESDLPRFQTLNVFYLAAVLGLPDIALGRLNRPGPWGFFRGYRRYREFTEPLAVAPRLNAVLRAGPYAELGMRSVFGWNYSRKRGWP